MNISYLEYFSDMSDIELNLSIKSLTEYRCDEGNMECVRLETIACDEWKKRHPGTIAPCIYDRAMKKGGFPSCYDGPTNTVNLEKISDSDSN